MIYLQSKYDIISVPFIREAYIICKADIIPVGYIIRYRRERISRKLSPTQGWMGQEAARLGVRTNFRNAEEVD